MKTLPFEAIIFDHDGTLVDTELPDFLAWQALYEEMGATIEIDYWGKTVAGYAAGYETLFNELIELQHRDYKTTKATLQQRLETLWKKTHESVELMPGVKPLLSQLHTAGYRLGVASASERSWVERWLTQFELLSDFEHIATIDNVTRNKPAPDIYLFAASQFGVAPHRCLVFEDTPTGIRAAKAAGMTVVAVPNIATKNSDLSQADIMVASLQEVTPAWIEAWSRIIY